MVNMSDNRVVVLVDMDCFYCQVEVRLNPAHQGKPLAVVQYNAWRGGGIIAVNYEARDKGVKRGMRGDEAKKLCPDIVLCKVAEVRGKADLTKYRDAGREVVEVLQEFSSCIQVASIDESYLDITEAVEERILQISEGENGVLSEKLFSTFVVGYTDDKSNDEDQRTAGLESWLECLSDPSCLRLAVGAAIAEEMRAAVFKQTSFRCSAGISYNKPLAKLVCGVHKPNRQTVLPPDKVELFFSTLPVRKMRNLGGKFGMEVVERLGCQTMGDLARFSLRDLQRHYDEKNGLWLYNMAHGIDHEPVTVRLIPKSIGCSKNFPGRTALATRKIIEHWLKELTTELVVRLTEDQTKNKRRAQHLIVSVSQDTDDGCLGTVARSGPLPCYNVDRIVALALQLISKTNVAPTSTGVWEPPVKNISLSAGKFTSDCSSQKSSIQSFFKQMGRGNSETQSSSNQNNDTENYYSSGSGNKHENSAESQEPYTRERKIKRSSLENYFKQTQVSSDNDASRDMFLDETSNGSQGNDIPEKSHVESCFNFSASGKSRPSVSSKSVGTPAPAPSQSRKRKSDAKCPDNLESAVAHSFFARYLVAKQGGGEHAACRDTSADTSNQGDGEEVGDGDGDGVGDGDAFEEMFEQCEECGKLVALQEFPEHVDYHSAVRLQKEINETLTPPDPPDPPRPSRASTSASTSALTSALTSASTSASTSAPSPPMERCSYCSRMIPLEDFPEHIDYHSALDLQRELNRPPPPPPKNNIINKKAGRPSKQASSPAKKGKYNSITSFFGPR